MMEIGHMNNVFYKVCRTSDEDKIVSMCYRLVYTPPDYKIVYELGNWVYPKNKKSKLFVYDSLKGLSKNNYIKCRFFECEVKNPIQTKIEAFSVYNADDFWESPTQENEHSHAIVSDNVYYTDAVKLVKEVYLNE